MGFGFGYGLRMGRWRAGGADQARPAITAGGTLDVATFEVGTPHTISPGTAQATGGGTLSYELRWLVGAVTLAQAGFTPQPADAGQSIAAQWRAVETGGSAPGASFWQTVGAGTVTDPTLPWQLTGSAGAITLTAAPAIAAPAASGGAGEIVITE